ncbi:uncharacterized protein DUF748 [Paraburkholderia sp. BL8N3]|nr:DUF748 domain-containing protein [Paraburkholderia sp. BL8N3]TCK38401.1 uncharacterized protein DUF748 [Paraburkholderia sp. BL8N3]
MASVTKHSLASATQTLRGVAHARRTRRIVIGLLIALAVIGLLGFFAAPPLIRHVAEQQLAEQLGRPVTIGRIALNPYTLGFEADRVHIGEAPANAPGNAANFIDIERLVVQPSWSSLFRAAPIIDEVKIDSPRISIVRYDAARFNFSDLIAKFSKPSPQPSKPARFAVSNIRLENGRIDFDDRLLKTRHVIDRFALGIPFIATLPSATDIFVTPSLQARIDGSPLSITGRTKPFSESRESEIALTLGDLDVPQVASYAPASLPVAIRSGRLTTDLNLRFSIADEVPTIRVNGTADLADLAVTDKQNAPLVAARALHVKVANAEPLRNLYHLDEVRLTQPDVKVARDAQGVLNFQKLAPAAAQKAPEPAPGDEAPPPLDLAITHLAVDGGRIAFDDRLVAQRTQGDMTNLAVTLDGFSTLSRTPARYTLKTSLMNGGTLNASGGFTLAGKRADLKLALDALALPPLQPYAGNMLAARIAGGTLGAHLPVSVDWSQPQAQIQVGEGDVTVKSLKLVPAASAAPVSLASAVAKIRKINVAARTAALDSVQVNGLSLDATRRKDGTIDLAALAGARESAPEPSIARKLEKAQAAGPAWRYQIGQIALTDGAANITDETTSKPVKLRIAPLAASVRQVSDDLTKPLAVDGKLTLNGRGALAVGGTVTVDPLKVALHVDGNQVDAAAFEPYFGDRLNVTVASALLSANGDVAMAGSGRALKASYKGDVSLTDVRMVDKASSDRFAGWKLLGLTNVKVNHDERGTDVDAARVVFANFYGRVLLDAQGKLNLRDVVAKQSGPAQSVTRDKSEAASAPAVASAPQNVTAATGPDLPVNLRFGQLVLQSGRVTYTDNFIKPNYTANLVQINGTIGAFGTHSTTPAPVNVAAKLAPNGPVSIKGQVNPLIAKPSLDLTASAHDIELTNLTPYSSKYAGYPITKGKLNVDLHYMLADDRLTANNHLFIDQLTFGDHVDNPSATKLPVRLAVSLLKNSRGEIDVNIPISGSLSNPEFSLGGLIWQAIVNLVQKAVTAPFTLLANAFGGRGEELGYVEFDPGSATLNDAAQKKLDTIAKALADKPSIKLDLSARVDPAVDEPALRAAYVDRQVKLAKIRDTVGKGASVDPSTVSVSPEEYTRYLTQVYKAADFKKPRNMIGMTKTLPDEEMKQALADNAPIDEADLRSLAQRRASNVQTYFEGKIDNKRIYIVAPKLSADGIKDKGAPTRVDFGLKS